MKSLFTMDIKNYAESDVPVCRSLARAVIETEDGKLAMVYSRKYQYYKFPGGEICGNEDKKKALIREVRRETGLAVKKDAVREYGSVLCLQKSEEQGNTFSRQEDFYYICTAETIEEQKVKECGEETEFELQYVCAIDAIAVNKACALEDDFALVMLAGDTEVLELFSGAAPEPSVFMADFLLRTAVKSNPGVWEQHSRYVAESAGRIAGLCPGMDAEKAYVYGMLHDIGRKFGVTYLAHVYDGYHYLLDLGYGNAAGIALSHSFHLKDINDYIGKFDISETAQEEIKALLAEKEYNDYDYLIQLCDGIAKADGIVSLEERMNDVKSRYGHYPQKKWERNIQLKEYFEEKMHENLYTAVGVSSAVLPAAE